MDRRSSKVVMGDAFGDQGLRGPGPRKGLGPLTLYLHAWGVDLEPSCMYNKCTHPITKEVSAP